MECLQVVSEDMVLPRGEKKLVSCVHFNFPETKDRTLFPYEQNPKSLAYVPKNKGEYYIRGLFNGGEAKDYLEMCEILDSNIDEDMKYNIVAKWHDESHLNSYLAKNPELFKILPLTYGVCEEYCIENPDIDPIIVGIDKKKYFDTDLFKGREKTRLVKKLRKFLIRIKWSKEKK